MKSPKYRILCDTAFSLFIQNGVKQVRVEAICQQAGVSKMTFYKYFKNKNDILQTVFGEWIVKKTEEARRILSGTDMLEERLKLLVKWKGEWVKDFSKEFVSDVYAADSPLKEILIQQSSESISILKDYFTKAKQAGKMNKDVSVDSLMFWINSMSNLLMDHSLENNFSSTEDMFNQLSSLYFYGIMGKGETSS